MIQSAPLRAVRGRARGRGAGPALLRGVDTDYLERSSEGPRPAAISGLLLPHWRAAGGGADDSGTWLAGRTEMPTDAAALAELAAQIQADVDALRPTSLFTSSATAAARQELELSDAYKIQRELRQLRQARGEICCGFKVGCTSPTIQATFGLSQPVRAYLWKDEQFDSHAALPASKFRSLGIEGELGVYIVDSTPASVQDWVVEWTPVIELHHYVWDGTPPTSVELVSRNAIHAGVVAAANSRRRGLLKDIPAESICEVCVNGSTLGAEPLAELNAGESFINGPVGTFSWLAEQLGGSEDWGTLTQAGSLVITSSPAGLYPVVSGDHVLVRCCGMEVSCTVVDRVGSAPAKM